MGNLLLSKDRKICKEILCYLKENRTLIISATFFKERNISHMYARSIMQRMTKDRLTVMSLKNGINTYSINSANIEYIEYFLMDFVSREDVVEYLNKFDHAINVHDIYDHYYQSFNKVAYYNFKQILYRLMLEDRITKSGMGENAFYSLKRSC